MMDDTDAQPDLFPALARVVRGASILFWCLPVAMVVSIMSTLSNWTDAAWPMGMLLPPVARCSAMMNGGNGDDGAT